MQRVTRNGFVLVFGLLGAFAAVGVGFAAIPGADGTIKGCYSTADGLLPVAHTKGELRAIDSAGKCRADERELNWNQQGPKGDPGAQGNPGPSTAFAATTGTATDLPSTFSYQVVVSKDVPAGSYAVNAMAIAENLDRDSRAKVRCRLNAPGNPSGPEEIGLNLVDVAPVTGSNSSTAGLPVQGTLSNYPGGKLEFACTQNLAGTNSDNARVLEGRLTAIKVGSVQ